MEAPTPLEMMVCSITTTLSVSDMRPPYSALASIGSTARRWRYSATASPNKPRKRPPNVGTRTVRYGFSEGIALSRMSDGMRKKASWHELRRLGHANVDQARTAADEGGQRDQPDLVGSYQRT